MHKKTVMLITRFICWDTDLIFLAKTLMTYIQILAKKYNHNQRYNVFLFYSCFGSPFIFDGKLVVGCLEYIFYLLISFGNYGALCLFYAKVSTVNKMIERKKQNNSMLIMLHFHEIN